MTAPGVNNSAAGDNKVSGSRTSTCTTRAHQSRGSVPPHAPQREQSRQWVRPRVSERSRPLPGQGRAPDHRTLAYTHVQTQSELPRRGQTLHGDQETCPGDAQWVRGCAESSHATEIVPKAAAARAEMVTRSPIQRPGCAHISNIHDMHGSHTVFSLLLPHEGTSHNYCREHLSKMESLGSSPLLPSTNLGICARHLCGKPNISEHTRKLVGLEGTKWS